MISKVAILEELNKPLRIEDVEIPKLGIGQVLVAVSATGICGKQLGEISGLYGEDKYLPHLLGHEAGAVVIDVGAGVKKVKKGDHVVVHWRKSSGIESDFPKYKRKNGSYVGAGLVATFAQYAVVSENRVTKIPLDIPMDVAALMGCAVTTAFGLLNNEAKLKIGQSIMVVGVGGVGLSVIQGASLIAANPIIAVDLYDKKLKLAKNVGADKTINASRYDIKKQLNFWDIKNLDVIVDFTGNVEVIEKCYNLLSPKGKLILAGQPRYNKTLKIDHFISYYSGRQIIASLGGLTDPEEDILRYLELYPKKVNYRKLITHHYKLSDINIALDMVRSGRTGRCIIIPF